MSKSKKRPTPSLRNGYELDLRFYRLYNPDTLYNKVLALVYVLIEQEQFKEKIVTVDGLHAEKPDDKYFEPLKAEIYFSEMHLFEALFALLIAFFTEQSDWLYLTTYTTSELKTAVEHFRAERVASITNNKATDVRDFVRQALYLGSTSKEEEKASRWDENLDNACWLLKRWADRYIENIEYNAYKHGLRVVTAGPSSVTMYLNDKFGNPQGEGYVIGASEDSLSFLELKEEKPGVVTVYETTKHFNPQESFFYIDAMHLMLRNIKNTRLAALENKGVSPTLYTFFDLNKEQIMQLRKFFTFSTSV